MTATGLDGTYRGSCVVCLTGTDTAVTFHGEAEWPIAALVLLGVERDAAVLMVSAATGCEPGKVPGGRVDVTVRVCRECASRTDFPVGVLGAVPKVAYLDEVDE